MGNKLSYAYRQLHKPASSWRRIRLRRLLTAICATVFVAIPLAFYLHPKTRHLPVGYLQKFTGTALLGGPPDWWELDKWEDALPQHNFSLPPPEGYNGRYVRFTNQIASLGWNNVLNEILMNAHLSYESNRSYVFQDYVWKTSYYPWPYAQAREWPPHTPLNALISGPAAGAPWTAGDPAPRAVNDHYWDRVCPPSRRRRILTQDIKEPVRWENGTIIFETWKKLLLEAPENCIEIIPAPLEVDAVPQTFDLWLWGSERILSLWDRFSKGPVSQLLRTSPVVEGGVAQNEHLFRVDNSTAYADPYSRMLAIHIRRGDFKQACLDLATWNSTFYSWNLLPFLPDSFVPPDPQGAKWGWNTEENKAYYLQRCLPSFDSIVEKVQTSRRDFVNAGRELGHTRTLDVMYILTNDRSSYVDDLKKALKAVGWKKIVTTADLEYNAEQMDVNMAIDMDIARRAAVFIGNGWSSFTSNIVHRRLVDGKEPISIRFY
ncbi:hypothetical protein GGF50DRAFT_56954 [Schizophyllum commune]